MKLIIKYNSTNYNFTDAVFAEYPKLKDEIEINEPKAMAQMNELKFILVTASETGTEIEQLNWLITDHVDDIERIQLLKNDDTLLSEGIVDTEGEIKENLVEETISIPIIDFLSTILEEKKEVFPDNWRTLYEWVQLIHTEFFIPIGVTQKSIPAEDDWRPIRPVDQDYLGYAYSNRKYKLNYDDLTLKEILKQISILGNCRIIIQNNTMIISLNDNENITCITPDGDLTTIGGKKEKLTEGYEISGNVTYNADRYYMASPYAVTPSVSPTGLNSGDYGSVWQDANGHQWELYSVTDVSGPDEDPEDRLEFNPYPNNPPTSPGYTMPTSGILTRITGGSETITISSSVMVNVEYLLNEEDVSDIVEDFYQLGRWVKYYNLDGSNSNLKSGTYFEHDGLELRATSVIRDLAFIEDDLQPVTISAIRRL